MLKRPLVNQAPVAMLVVLSLLSGCSSDDGSFSDDGSSTTAAGDQTTAADSGTADGGNASSGDSDASGVDGGTPSGAGDDFPVEIREGWVKDVYADIGLTVEGSVQLMYPNDDFDELVSFYDEWTSGQADEYLRSEATGFAHYNRMESPNYSISISKDMEERGEFFTQLLISIPNG